MSHDPNSRFQVVETPYFAPGADFITKSIEGPFIDTGVVIEPTNLRPRLYLNRNSVREMADQFDFFVEYEKKIEAARLDGYQTGYQEAIREDFKGELDRLLDSLLNVVDALRGGADSDPDPAPEVVEQDDQQPAGGPSPKRGRSRKAASKPRPADVSDAPGDEPPLAL